MLEEILISMEALTLPAEIKVAIIEDRREIRDGLAMSIGGTEGFRCTGTFRSMEEALAKINSELPDVVLCDIGLPINTVSFHMRRIYENSRSIPNPKPLRKHSAIGVN